MFLNSQDRSVKTIIITLLLIVVFGVGFSFGQGSSYGEITPYAEGKVVNQQAKPPKTIKLKDINFKQFWDVWKIVQTKYLDQPVADEKLFYGALKGMVSGLGDPHTVYLDPALMKKFDEQLKGAFDGIGAELGIKNKKLTIIAPLPSTPAERAGLKAKDWIVKIEKEETDSMSVEEAVTKIRGKKGTPVRLTVFREGFDEPKEFIITRDRINVVSVKSEDKSGFSYIKILDFDERVSANFAAAVDALMAKKSKGIILDLRNNPGGLLDASIDLTSYWLRPGEIAVKEQWRDRTEDYPAVRSGVLASIPTVVLVNEGSASASEIMAGALQDYGRAKLVGEKTFGKGSVQELQKLADGSAVKITIARWLTPKGRQINEVGIKPDFEVKETKEDRDADRDPQLDKAIEILNGVK